jgi:hypothetical protein
VQGEPTLLFGVGELDGGIGTWPKYRWLSMDLFEELRLTCLMNHKYPFIYAVLSDYPE